MNWNLGHWHVDVLFTEALETGMAKSEGDILSTRNRPTATNDATVKVVTLLDRTMRSSPATSVPVQGTLQESLWQ